MPDVHSSDHGQEQLLSAQLRVAASPGSEVSQGGLPKNRLVEFGVGQQPLQSAILLLEILQPLGLVYPEATVLLLPSVVRLLRHTDLLDRLNDGLTSPHLDFDLSQIGDDLLSQFFLSVWY